MGISEKILKKVETKKRIKIPSVFFNSNILKKLDRTVETGNPYVISRFYKDYKKYIDLSTFSFLEIKLKKSRDNLTLEDKELIKKITSIQDKDQEFFLELSGNILYISELLENLDNILELPKNIKIAVILYSYLTMVELFTSYIGELIVQKIHEEHLERKNKDFLSKFDNNEHAEIGTLKNELIKTFCLNESFMKNTVFYKNRLLRNKISHANIFYDSREDKIYQTDAKEYTFEQIIKDCEYLFNFLLEMIFFMNGQSNELISNLDIRFNEMAKKYLKCSRFGLKKQIEKIIIEMQKS